MAHALKLTRGRFRLRLAAVIAVVGLFGAVPAASQAIVAFAPQGISGAGTVTGTWTSGAFAGQSQVVQVASVVSCFSLYPPQTSFVGDWTDPAGASHRFRYDTPFVVSCTFAPSQPPSTAELRGGGSSSGLAGAPADNSTIDETLEGPNGAPPNTMQFTLATPEGTISVSPQFPGRIQAFGGVPSGT